MKSFSMTDVGLKRSMNQDYLFCEENEIGNLPNLFVVADGMGGHRAGDYASRFCVKMLTEAIEQSTEVEPVEIFDAAIGETNARLYHQTQVHAELEGAGTTLVAATIVGDTMYVANVGDSRLYVVHDESAEFEDGPCTITQVTEDHSLVELMIRTGEIKREEARNHPNKNVITRALGAAPKVEADYFEVELQEGDKILLCSDGLTNMVEDEEIKEIVRESGDVISVACRELIKRANAHGGLDNIAVVLVKP
ncbi:Stp1/IreP family PP2C-type Ser/Thr phosphatase [Anaerolentibacter hominis]|uniref:Stp1/IreP family PP2C-type Ser/Thr phosphatase n=1 Tax=Anaerolentibacter hominis TaxID=3079009 RepID=UPI0031B87DE1